MNTLLFLIKKRRKSKVLLIALLLCTAASGSAWAQIYVATNGSDDNGNGTSASPYATLQKAHDMATTSGPNSTILVRAGVYRQQVSITKDGLTFRPENMPAIGTPSDVIINGTDLIGQPSNGSGLWTQAVGTTYKINTTGTAWRDLYSPRDVYQREENRTFDPGSDKKGFGENQLFLDTTMMHELRWPHNISTDIAMPTMARADGATYVTNTSTTILDSEFDGNPKWIGAKIFINLAHNGKDGQGYIAKVLNVGPGSITVNYYRAGTNAPWTISGPNSEGGEGTEYYLFDPNPAIMTEADINGMLGRGEWYKKGTTLYVKTFDEGIPNSTPERNVNSKTRYFAFAGNGLASNYKVEGFQLFGCSVATATYAENNTEGPTSSCSGVTFNNLFIRYVSHQVLTANWQQGHNGWTGVVLNGRDHILSNCIIKYSATSAVSLQGDRHQCFGNKINSTNYMLSNAGALNTGRKVGYDQNIGNNVISNTAHCGIYYPNLRNSSENNKGVARIHHNTIFNFCLRTGDSGAIDFAGQDFNWVRLDHNYIFFTNGRGNHPEASLIHGLYVDFGRDARNDTPPSTIRLIRLIVDHNVVTDMFTPMLLSGGVDVEVYNNTLIGNGLVSVATNAMFSIGNYNDYGNNGERNSIFNNILSSPPNLSPEPFGFNLGKAMYINNIDSASVQSGLAAKLFVSPKFGTTPYNQRSIDDFKLQDNSTTQTLAIDEGNSLGFYKDGVQASNVPDLGAIEWGGTIMDNVVPSQPAVPTANVTEKTISLSWPVTPDTGGSGIAYYEFSSSLFPTKLVQDTSFSLTGLTKSTNYSFSLVAVDRSGNRSAVREFMVRTSDPVADVTIPKTVSTPAIDGSRETATYTGPVSPIAVLAGGTAPASAEDLSANWTASWDAANLYLHIAVTDDVRKVDSDRWYDDDNVEIFLNGNGERPDAWGAHDYQLFISPGGVLKQWKNWSIQDAPVGVIAQTSNVGTTGYNVELKVPFSALGISSPAELQFIGMEVNIGDDDGLKGTSISRKIAWKNEAYQGPSRFSLAQLTGATLSDRTDPVGSGIVTARGEDAKSKVSAAKRNAFDNNPDTQWIDSQPTSWIQFQFDGTEKYAVSKYTVTSAASDKDNDKKSVEADPKSWTLYGTNVANATFPADYVAIDTRSNIAFASRKQTQIFTVNNSTEYSAYRLEITANNGSKKEVRVGEVELFAPPRLIPVTGVNLAAESDTLDVRAQQRLTASVTPATAFQGITWETSDAQVATVDSSGLVTTIKEGSVVITARSVQDSTKTATTTIAVVRVGGPLVDRTDPVGSGIITVSGEFPEYGGGKENAFNNRTDGAWGVFSSSGWIQYKFSADGLKKYAVKEYTISVIGDAEIAGKADPKNWILYGTNAANPVFPQDYVALDTRSNIAFNRLEKKTFFFSNSTEYSAYRLQVSSNNGHGYMLLIEEIELFAPEPAPVTPPPAANLVDRTDPVGSGVITVNGEFPEYGGGKENAFNNKSDGAWGVFSSSGWIQYKFSADGSKKYAVQQYTISVIGDAEIAGKADPKNWTLYGTNAANPVFPQDYVALDTRSNIAFNRLEKKTFSFSNTTEYNAYRLEVTANNGHGYMLLIEEIELLSPAANSTPAPGQWIKVDDNAVNTSNHSTVYSGFSLWSSPSDNYYLNTVHYSELTGSEATFSFTGDKVRIYGLKRDDLGEAEVFIDEALVQSIDLYSGTLQSNQLLFESSTLTAGEHTVKVRVKGTKNPASAGTEIVIDAFEYIFGAPVAPPTGPLTDRTDPVGSGVITASGETPEYGGAKEHAFDNDAINGWSVFSTTPWIQFQFSSNGSLKYAVQQYTVTSSNSDHHPDGDPKNWTLYGTNVPNASFPGDYVALDTRSDIVFTARREKQTFAVGNTTEYSTYRLQITATAGYNATFVGEIELFAPGSSTPTAVTGVAITPATAGVFVGGQKQLTSNVSPSTASQEVTWTSDNSAVATVSSSGVVTGVSVGTATITARSTADNTKTATSTVTVTEPQPPMALTDRTDPVGSGVVTVSGEFPEYGGGKENAFDNNPETIWGAFSTTPWIQFKFSNEGTLKYAVQQYTISSNNSAGNVSSDPKSWTLYGTNAANPTFPADFVALDTRSDIAFTARKEKQTFTVSNNTEYSTYRLNITANAGSASNTQVGEIELFAPDSQSGTATMNAVKGQEQLQFTTSTIADKITVFPNPVTNGWITVGLNGADLNKNVSVTLSDLSGRVVYKDNFISNGNSQRLNIGALQQGIYVIRITGANTRFSSKVIIE
jgi:uncharacterized protein YjdB